MTIIRTGGKVRVFSALLLALALLGPATIAVYNTGLMIAYAQTSETATPQAPDQALEQTKATEPVPATDVPQITVPVQPGNIWATLLPLIITAIVPMIIMFTKQWIPKMPSWLIPILTPVLGIAIALVINLMSDTTLPWYTGAILGGLATWLREFYDQIKKANVQTSP